MKHRREIDGLRAFAILPVLLFHAGFSWMPGGFLGVDVFFVISGFLITGIVVAELHTRGKFSIVGFYERRARRIMPALFTVLAVMYPIGWFLLFPDQWAIFSQSYRSIIFFASNYFFLGKMGYFDPNIDLNPMLHTWSLAIEEQFYIFFPLLLWLIWKVFKERFWIPILSLMGIGSLLWAQFHYAIDPNSNFYLLQYRAWELIAGALAAIYLSHRKSDEGESGPRSSQILSTAGLLAVVYSYFGIGSNFAHPGFITLVPVLGTVMVILFAGPGTLVRRVLSWRVFVGVGLISYSAYLWHQPIFAFFRVSLLHDPKPRDFIPLIALTLLLSWGSWKFIENPFRARKRFSRKFIFSAVAACMVLVFGITSFAEGKSLQNQRSSLSGVSFKQLSERLSYNHGLGDNCVEFSVNLAGCTHGSNPNTLLWGDSHAMFLAGAMADSPTHLAFIQHTLSACNPVLGVAQQNPKYGIDWAKRCVQHNSETISWLSKHSEIKNVILSSPWYTALWPSSVIYRASDGTVGPAGSFGWSRFDATIKAIQALGKKVLVVTPTPQNGQDIGSCEIRVLANRGDPSRCDFTPSKVSFSKDKVISEHAVKDGAATFSWFKYICPNGVCDTIVGSTLIYRDASHLSKEGSAYLGKTFDIAGQLQKILEAKK